MISRFGRRFASRPPINLYFQVRAREFEQIPHDVFTFEK